MKFRSGDSALGRTELARIQHELIEGRSPRVANLLLNDARYLAHEAASADAPRALLAAAMACEIKAKEVILSRCHPKARPAVGQLVHRTSSIPRLLDAVMAAATKHSLKDADRALYKKACRLFHLRNEIVHEGRNQDPSEAWPLVVAARQVVEWLDAIEPLEV